MNVYRWKIFVCLMCAVSLTDQRTVPLAQADEPPRLVHRWEIEPDLGIVWLTPPTRPAVKLHPEKFASEQLQVVLDEAQLAILHAGSEQLEGRQAALKAMLQRLRTDMDNRQVRLALAGAAIALADASHASALWQELGHDTSTRPLIERALLGWKRPQAHELWRSRLQDESATLHDLHLAASGIGALGAEQDAPALENLLRSDGLPIPTKIVVARALGQVMDHGLEKLASDVLDTQLEHRELLAAELLSHHTSPQASQVLQAVLDSEHQPARLAAYTAISRNYPERARALAEQMLSQSDNNLRAQAVSVLDKSDDVESLRLQSQRIGDKNYEVRNAVRSNLLRKAQRAELKPVVDEIIGEIIGEIIYEQLSGEDYRAIEQAILLSVALDDTQWCPAYLKLLDFPRPETSLLAAWALQELAHTPQHMQAVLQHVQTITERLQGGERVDLPEQLRQSFLLEALGRNRYQPALETLKLYIPKQHTMGDLCRTSAIWAIGKIVQDSQDQPLAAALAERMLDESLIDPEDLLVQYASTVALGWIKAPGSLEQVNKLRPKGNQPLIKAAEWSVEQLAPSSDSR